MVEILNQGSELDPEALRVSTKKRHHIPNQPEPQRSRPSMDAARTMILNQIQAVCRSLDSTYNCMGMVFANRRTAIEPEHFALIAREDDYYQFDNPAEVQVGDIAVYADSVTTEVVHVGVIVSKTTDIQKAISDIQVLSQFGKDGEYFHALRDIPHVLEMLVAHPIRTWFLTDRKS